MLTTSMKEEKILDAVGKDLQIGDWVKVISVPLSIQNMPIETKKAFSSAVGHTFQIEDIHESGELELDLWPKVGLDTIWLEPYCTLRFRRYHRQSQRFQKILALRRGLEKPRYVLEYTIRYKEQYPLERILEEFDFIHDLRIGHGFSYDQSERRMEGTLSIFVHQDDGIARLKHAENTLRNSSLFETFSVKEITVREFK